MASERTGIRVLLLGDSKVGKSSLITTLLSEEFQDQVASVVPEVCLPVYGTSDNIPTQIVDTSSWKIDRPIQEREIKKADVICLVYDIARIETFERICSYWLPLIRALTENSAYRMPVILVGNKIDLRGDSVTYPNLEKDILPIMDTYKEVETCIECSAKRQLNVNEVFYFARNSVLYPSDVLYDSTNKRMKDDCIKALKRIFHLCDRDNDGYLNDNELNQFQRRVFSASLQDEELAGIKDVVRAGMPSGISEEGLNVKGFLYLQHLFVQKGRLESTWTVLRKFGYGDDLQLRESYLCPPLPVSKAERSKGHYRSELTPAGLDFLADVFDRHDKSKNGTLNQYELEEAFSVCVPPSACPHVWGSDFPSGRVETNERGHVTLQGWLSIWSATALTHPEVTLKYLGYLGYEGNLLDAITFKERKLHEPRTLRCYVFGKPASTKASFLNGLIGRRHDSTFSTTRKHFVVNQLQDGSGSKFLLMYEFGQEEEKALMSERKMSKCDVVCIFFDTNNIAQNAEYIARTRDALSRKCSHIPCFYIATEPDHDSTLSSEEIVKHFERLRIREPRYIKPHHAQLPVYEEILQEALNPASKHIIGKCHEYSSGRLISGILLAAVIIGLPIGYYYWRASKRQ